ncbi:hypothetical protein DXG01_016382 [Tephrocybe rancida]|nr:hypothetical protein DXG01_016382 [Tephrocybe rancida]
MSPPTKRYTHSAGSAPNIPLPQNSKAPRALKPSETQESTNKDADVPEPAQPKKTIQEMRQSRNTNKDIATDGIQAPPPVQECPVPHQKKTTAPATAALGTNAEDGSFIQPHALKKWLPDSPSDFEMTKLDEDDDVVFQKEIEAMAEAKAKAKTKKGKGKARDNNGPFKLGPILDEVKERLYAIHANFERQVEELAAEIGKLPHLLFSLLGETPLPTHHPTTPWGAYQVWYGVHGERKKPNDMLKEEWARIVSFEYNKYCNENLSPLSKDPDARTELLKLKLEWYAAKYGMYAEEKKTDGTFNKVITKAQQDFVHLLNMKDDEGTESREEVEKQLWSVLDPGSLLKHNDNCKTFLAWLGNDIGVLYTPPPFPGGVRVESRPKFI